MNITKSSEMSFWVVYVPASGKGVHSYVRINYHTVWRFKGVGKKAVMTRQYCFKELRPMNLVATRRLVTITFGQSKKLPR